MQHPEYKVARRDGTTVREGDELLVDNNLPVTFLGLAEPSWGDDETGEYHPAQLSVRFPWGAAEVVTERRLGVVVNEI